MPKNQPDHDTAITEEFAQTVLEYNSRMRLVKYLGLAKSLEIAALILGPAANPDDKADIILAPYRKLAESYTSKTTTPGKLRFEVPGQQLSPVKV
jgi:hypothetical protein